jgi:hypothetical protein
MAVDRSPLKPAEKALIRKAEVSGWSGLLRASLAVHVSNRGGHVSRHDTCGDLVDWLETTASSREERS